MISTVRISNFKNYGCEEEVSIGNKTDEYHFSVVIGRNGSGKSSLIDALEWCCSAVARKSLSTRANRADHLLRAGISKTIGMYVEIDFVDPKTRKRLRMRTCYKSGKTSISGNISSDDVYFQQVPPGDISTLLQQEFGININHMSRILVKQNTTSIACSSPLALLAFIEGSIGTSEMIPQIQEQQNTVKLLGEHIITTNRSIQEILQQQDLLKPKIKEIYDWQQEWLSLQRSWIAYFESSMNTLRNNIHHHETNIVHLEDLIQSHSDRIQDAQRLVAEQHVQVSLLEKRVQLRNKIVSTLRGVLSVTMGKLDAVGVAVLNSKNDVKKRRKKYVHCLTQLTEGVEHRKSVEVRLTGNVEDVKLREKEVDDVTNAVQSLLSDAHKTNCQLREKVLSVDDFCRVLKPHRVALQRSDAVITNATNLRESISYRQKLVEVATAEQAAAEESNRVLQASIHTVQVELDEVNAQIADVTDAQTTQRMHVRQADDVVKRLQSELEEAGRRLSCSERERSRLQALSRLRSLVAELCATVPGILGLFVDLVQPSSAEYTRALLEVLGANVTNIVVVMSRNDACLVADQCRLRGVSDIAIDILDEMRQERAPRDILSSTYIPLQQCVITRSDITAVVMRRLGSWLLFTGTYQEALTSMSPSNAKSVGKGVAQLAVPSAAQSAVPRKGTRGRNTVSIDGFRFFCDGEIRSGKQQVAGTGTGTGSYWPGNSSSTSGHFHDAGDNAAVERRLSDLRLWLDQAQKAAAGASAALAVLDGRVLEMHSCRDRMRSQIIEMKHKNVFVDKSVTTVRKVEQERADLLRDRQLLEDALARQREAQTALQELLYTSFGAHGSEMYRLVTVLESHRHSLQLALSQQRLIRREHESAKLRESKLAVNKDVLISAISEAEAEVVRVEARESFHANQCQMLKEDLCAQEVTHIQALGRHREAKAQLEKYTTLARREAATLRPHQKDLESTKKDLSVCKEKLANAEKQVKKAKEEEVSAEEAVRAQRLMDDDKASGDVIGEEAEAATYECGVGRVTAVDEDEDCGPGLAEDEKPSASITAGAGADTDADGGAKQIVRSRRRGRDRSAGGSGRGSEALEAPADTDVDAGSRRKRSKPSHAKARDLTPDSDADPQTRALTMAVTFERLSRQSTELQDRRRKLDFSEISLYNGLCDDVVALSADVASAQERAVASQRRASEMQSRRFETLMQALHQINDILGLTYSRLVSDGDCHLSFPSAAVSLFDEGVQMLAQHGTSSWKELLLALQDTYPSQLYVMDEVDAALDTRTALRLGLLLREKALATGAQFVLVSHRAELHLAAARMLGIYLCHGSPRSISYAFSDTVRDEVML